MHVRRAEKERQRCARERLLGGVRVAMLTERSWCGPVRCVPQASPGSGRRASSTATFTTRLARPSRYALALGSIGHPRRHRPPRARCLPVRADHRRFVRDEEGRLGRQALQPWHLGARSPLSVVMAGLASCVPTSSPLLRSSLPATTLTQDTAGQERFDSLSSFYCRGARAAIICFDLTDRASFECLQTKWIRKVNDEAEPGCHICLVGTKLDLIQAGQATRAVRTEEVEVPTRPTDPRSRSASPRCPRCPTLLCKLDSRCWILSGARALPPAGPRAGAQGQSLRDVRQAGRGCRGHL